MLLQTNKGNIFKSIRGISVYESAQVPASGLRQLAPFCRLNAGTLLSVRTTTDTTTIEHPPQSDHNTGAGL